MSNKTYCYQFSEQKVFAPEHAPISVQIKNNLIFVALNNFTVAVYNVVEGSFNLINSFSVCGLVLKIDYCALDDFIITLECKNNDDSMSTKINSIRTYHNWRCSDERIKMRFRPALGSRNSGSGSRESADKTSTLPPFRDPVTEVLEFLHLSNPLSFGIYTNPNHKRVYSCKNQPFEELSSNVAVSENTYLHLYRLCQQHRNSISKLSKPSVNINTTSTNTSSNFTLSDSSTEMDNLSVDNNFCFQHLFTVNFSFIIQYICIYSDIFAVASMDKVQVIRILEEKINFEKYSTEMENVKNAIISKLDINIEKCWLTSISNARKITATKQKARPREIIGPTQNLDTASITLLRYADSKQMSFETLLFRKYLITSSSSHIQSIQLARVNGFEEYGLFIMRPQEIVQYSFLLKQNEVIKVADYDFKGETAVGMCFSDHVNLLHVAFNNGDLVTYNSRLCSTELFQSPNCESVDKKSTTSLNETIAIKKLNSLTRLNKVTLMGLTDVKVCGNLVLCSCQYSFADFENMFNDNVIGANSNSSGITASSSMDSWNFYLFTQPNKRDLKENIISNAEYKGSKKLLQMLLCSLLTFPDKSEITHEMIQNIIICCLKTEANYTEIVPSLLMRDDLSISDALNIFQILETKELYENNLFKYYAKKKLMNTDFSEITEDQFRWIIMKVLNCSVELLFDMLVSNTLEDALKVDLLIIESIKPDDFESSFIKILYYSAHNEFDLAEPLLTQLDLNEVGRICTNHPHLIYNNSVHTSLGWLINLYWPHLYAQIVAACFLNECEDTVDFRNLEITKQVGQCSFMLTLEEVLYILLQKYGIISNHNSHYLNNSRGQYKRLCSTVTQSFSGTNRGHRASHISTTAVENSFSDPNTIAGYHSNFLITSGISNNKNNDNSNMSSLNNSTSTTNVPIYKYYIDQLIMHYHEFSYNGVEFCPHKLKQTCREIPHWLKNLRFHEILNQFSPFKGSDPFISPHVPGDNKNCSCLSCQTYLIRLQALLSWKESENLFNLKIISASCESNDHPAWKSLQFLLFQSQAIDIRDMVEIINFIQSQPVKFNGDNSSLLDIYLTKFADQLTVLEWEKVITNITNNNISFGNSIVAQNNLIDNLLRYACLNLSLDQFLILLNSLRELNTITCSSLHDWIERSGRCSHRETVFVQGFEQLVLDLQ